MTNPASQLAPPTLHWGTVGPSGDSCDLCHAPIKPHGDCFLSIRRAFELAPDHRRMIETAPLKVLMCVDCGWQRPYAPVPREGVPMAPEAPKVPQNGAQAQDGVLEDAP